MKKLLFGISALFMGSGAVLAHEYPTYETVHYALNCMNELGGQNDENLYTCTCRYDAIREAMTFSDYEEGRTFERNKSMPGEKGAAFRDNERGERLYEELVKAREAANASCIVVKQVKMVKPTNSADKPSKK